MSNFTTFSAEWKKTSMGHIGTIYGGLSGKSKVDFGSGNARYVTFLGVLENVILDVRHTERVHVGRGESQNPVLKGDLLFNASSETPGDLAIGAVMREQLDNLYLNSFCFGFRIHDKNRHVPLFLAYFFRGSVGRDIMNALAQGATRYNMSKSQFRALELSIPCGDEQRAIAEVLSDVDGLLNALEALIAKKQAIKQATMQQLLTGKTRLPGFSGAWIEKPLADLALITMGQSPSSLFYNLRGEGLPLIQGNADIENQQTIERVWTTQANRRCKLGDLILTVRAPVGSVAVASKNACIGRGVCSLKPFGDSSFLFHVLVHAEDRWQSLEQGSTFTAANSEQVGQFRLCVPNNKREQHAIASVLSDMDAEITALEQRRDKTRAIKQGMMQQLLTGRVRLLKIV